MIIHKTDDFSIFKRIIVLTGLVNYHSRLYYEEDSPILSDKEFDQLYKKLEALEASNPQFLLPDSPTQRVGGKAAEQFTKIKHLTPMYSLDKIHTVEEFEAWNKKVGQLLKDNQ